MITNREYKILNQLRLLAIDVAPAARAKLAAAVVIKGEVVSWGENQIRSHPFQLRFGKNSESQYWHAETHAIYNALKRVDVTDLNKASLYVVRVKRPHAFSQSWNLAVSKPCRGCEFCASSFGIRRVIYSIDNDFAEMDLNPVDKLKAA